MSKADFYAAKVKRLQPMPAVVTQLLRNFSDPDHDLDEAVQLLRVEPTLTAEVMRRANTVAFAGSEPATDVFEAVSRIGMYEAYCAVTFLAGSRAMAIGNANGGIPPADLWRHSVIAAVAAGQIALRANEPEAPAFTAGLLHDLGKMIFSHLEPAKYAAVVNDAGKSGPTLVAAEQQRFDANHAQVGGCLLAHWGLPTNVVAAVMSHHQSPATALRCERLASVVQVANLFAGAFDLGVLPNSFAPTLAESMEILKITENELPEILQEIRIGIEKVEDLLQMAT